MDTPIDPHTRQYIRQVNAIPRLSQERELALASAWLERRDQAAAHAVVRANLRHVIPLALRYRGRGPSLGDLIAQGNLALMAALERFEPARGFRFITYANHWIRAEILALVLQSRSMVGGGRGHQRSRYVFQLQRELAHLTSKHGRSDEVYAELSERFGRAPEELAHIVALLERRDASLEATTGDGSSTLGDRLAEEGARQDEVVERDAQRDALSHAVAAATTGLDERERFIVEHRLMADDDSRSSLADVGERFGVSRERARQIECRVKDKLRKRLAPVARGWDLDMARAA